MSISRDEVARIGRLARLALTDEELDGLTRDLGEIVAYVDRIGALEAAPESGAPADVVPASTPLRDDEARPSLPQAEALRPSADHDDEFFRVPPVIDREEPA